MAVYGYVRLCTAMNGYVWLRMAAYGYVSMYSYVQLWKIMYGCVWLYVYICVCHECFQEMYTAHVSLGKLLSTCAVSQRTILG